MAEFASNGKANAALTTGIIGTSGVGLGLLAQFMNGFKNVTATAPAANQMTDTAAIAAMAALAANGRNNENSCSENHLINRYEAAQAARIAELETEVKLRDANTYTDGKIADMYERLNTKFENRTRELEQQICNQNVYNATNTAAIACIQGQIAQLQSLTKLVIPNGSVCPGYGEVTVSPKTATAAAS